MLSIKGAPFTSTIVIFAFGLSWLPLANAQQDWGKSHHGSHYDQGPRSKPWIIEGIGQTHFPITSSHPEVQKWFDQGNTLLHGFWQFEAERAFRWCLKLDPDCAMAYWGLARCVEGDASRERRFFREAVKRKDQISQRERDYIELWEAKFAVQKSKKADREKKLRRYVKLFDKLLINYPDDIEARALYWLETLKMSYEPGDSHENPIRYAMDRVLQEVLATDPNHVGALHYRVHNWDGEEGHYALESCLHLSKVAPNCGHLQHMPGHVLSSIGLWQEAAIAMDSATRVEKEYMQRRMVLPEDNWDYMHNLDYLCYIQEQLGMYEAAFIGANQMLHSPPSYEVSSIVDFANLPMIRLLVKFEKWEEILENKQLFNDQGMLDEALLAYAHAQALIGLGRIEEAEKQINRFEAKTGILKLPTMLGKIMSKFSTKNNQPAAKDEPSSDLIGDMIKIKRLELRGKLALVKGETTTAIECLEKGAELQHESWQNDPPRDPTFLYTTLGEVYLELGQNEDAVKAFEKTLEKIIYDGFALSGLVVAHHNLGNEQAAAEAMGRLQAVWKNADRPNRWLQIAEATGVKPAKVPDDNYFERNYQEWVLNKKGHSLWSPPMAPDLRAMDADGKTVSLADYQGKNVILIFYLGDQCLHCMEQIQLASRLSSDFALLETEIVAISKDDISKLKSYSTPELGIRLLSDPGFENARRFNSYDDFEGIELHSTILIDQAGRVHWSRHGGDPFMDFEFLKHEVKRINGRTQ